MAKKPQHQKGRGKKKPFKKGKKTGAGAPKNTKKNAKHAAIDKQVKDPNAGMRLNKYISNSGICSRRDADIFIASGNVKVNGKVITEMGYKVKLTDEVKFDGRRINPEQKEYILLNKPAGFYVTGSIERNNRTVMDLVARASKSRLAPVGKLETSAKGLLLFTNDGTLAKKLVKNKHGIRQIYHVELSKKLSATDLELLKTEGVRLEDGLAKPKEISYIRNKNEHHIGVELHSTRQQVVQRMFKKLGYTVINLDRVVYGGLTKKDLPRGRHRPLTRQEVINLGML